MQHQLPSEIGVQLTYNGTAQPTVTFDTTGFTAGDTLVMNVQVASAVTASGSYPWTINVNWGLGSGSGSGSASGGPVTLTGTDHVAVSSATEGVRAGDGWTFAGVNRLIPTSDGVIWKDGEGFGEFFANGSSGSGGGMTFISPAGDFGSLVENTDDSYTYTAKGALWTDDFTSAGLQTDKVTADGQRTTFTYSGVNLTGIQTPDGRLVTMTYDGSGNLQTVEGPAGTATVTHDSSANLTGVERPDTSLFTYSYDSAGRMTVEHRPDSLTSYTYETHGLVTGIDRGLGVTETVQPVLETGWGPTAAAPASVVGVLTDALSRPTTITLDRQGDAAEIQAGTQSAQAGYNSNYQPVITVNGDNLATLYSYSSAGDQTTVTTPNGATTTMTYDATLHELTSSEDPLGNRTTMTYSSTGDLLTTKDPTGAVTTNTWSGGLLQSTTNPLNQTTSYVYDSNNDLIAVIAPSGLRTSYTYDAAGDQTSVEQPDGTITTTVYDSMGNAVGTINPDGSHTSAVYDGEGQLVAQSDVRGNWTTYVYDSDGRQIATVDNLGNRTTTVYDDANQVIATVDPYGNRTSYVYDSAARRSPWKINTVISLRRFTMGPGR